MTMRTKTLIACAAVAVTGGAASIATAVDNEPSAAQRAEQVGAGERAPATRPATSADRAEMFPVLRRQAARNVPDAVRRFAQTPQIEAPFAPNVALARTLRGQADGPGWYVIPADGALCLFAGAAGTCATDEDAAAGRLVQLEIAAPPAPRIAEDGTPELPDRAAGSGEQRFRGLAPAGVTTVTAAGADGSTSSADVGDDGSYELEAVNAESLTLAGPSKRFVIALRQ